MSFFCSLEDYIFSVLRERGYYVCRNCYVYFGGACEYVSTVNCYKCEPEDFHRVIEELVLGLGPFVYGGKQQCQYEIDVVGYYGGMWYIVEVKDYSQPVPCHLICYHYARASHFAQRAAQRAQVWYPVYATTSWYESHQCNCGAFTVEVRYWRHAGTHCGYSVSLYKLVEYGKPYYV